MRWSEIVFHEGKYEHRGHLAKLYVYSRYRWLLPTMKRSREPGVALWVDDGWVREDSAIERILGDLVRDEPHVGVQFIRRRLKSLDESPQVARRGKRHNVIQEETPVAAIRSPRVVTSAEDPLKHWVNRPQGRPDEGPSVHVMVCDSRDLDDLGVNGWKGSPAQKVFAKVTFDADNSARTGDKGLWLDDAPVDPVAEQVHGQPLVFELETTLESDTGGPCGFDVQLGVSGGDRCTIEVGFVKGEWTAILHVLNWRKIGIQSVAADSSFRRPAPQLIGDDAAIAGSLIDVLNELYAPAFIELFAESAVVASWETTKTALLMHAAQHGGDPEYKEFAPDTEDREGRVEAMKSEASFVHDEGHAIPDGTAFIAGYGTVRCLRDYATEGTEQAAVPNASVAVTWCDMMFEAPDKPPVEVLFRKGSPQTVDHEYHIFRNNPITGKAGVGDVAWCLRIGAASDSLAWVGDIDRFDTSELNVVRQTLRDRNLSDDMDAGPLGSYVYVDDWSGVIALDHSQRWTVTLPEGLAALMNEIDEKRAYQELREQWVLQLMVGVRPAIYGAAGISMSSIDPLMMKHPVVAMPTYFGTGIPAGVGSTLAHEIGHALGQAYIKKQGDPAFGRSAPISGLAALDTTDNEGYGKVLDDGPYYVEHGHVGNHCSSGISADLMNGYPQYNHAEVKELVASRRNCVMWGAGGNFHEPGGEFCEVCVTFLRATDCSNLQREW